MKKMSFPIILALLGSSIELYAQDNVRYSVVTGCNNGIIRLCLAFLHMRFMTIAEVSIGRHFY